MGYYGAGRIADDLIEYAIKNTIKEIRPDAIVDSYKVPNLGKIGTNYDFTILGGGTLLGLINWSVQTPLAIFGTGYREQFPLDKEYAKRVSKKFLEKAKWIVLRGKYSLAKCQEVIDIEDKLLGLGDSILLLDPPERTEKFIVGSNLRKMPKIEPSHYPSSYYEDVIPVMVDLIAREGSGRARYLSFCKAEDIAPSGREMTLLESPSDAIREMNFRFWIGQRLHSSGLALLRGIPTIFFNYQFNKGRDFCSAIDYPYVLDFRGLKEQDLGKLASLYFEVKKGWNKEEVMRKVKETRKQLRKSLKVILEETI